MLTVKKALSIITETDDDKRNAAIDKLSEANAKQLAKAVVKAARDHLDSPLTELGLD